jgi:SAM-dependent methyltransferase/ribosome-associated toxin RatA of RatAB toxin-antitoxin module/esterase/lipase
MIELSRKIVLSVSPKRAYSILKDVGSFPKFISGIEQISSKKVNSNLSINHWNINMQGINIAWKEQEITDDINYEIVFKRLSGSFDTLEGIKKVKNIKGGSEILISLKIDWKSNKGVKKEIIARKTNLAMRWMLRSIQQQLTHESILNYEHIDKYNNIIVSELVKIMNNSGKIIIGFFDYMKPFSCKNNIVVIPPGYGETKRDSLMLSYYMVANGFGVIRYDNTDHIGESDGEIFYTTLPKMKNDVIAVVDYAEKRFKINKIGVVATSLAKRIALKAATEDSRIAFLIGLVGIVDLKSTLKAVYQQDLIGLFESDKDPAFCMAEVLGFEVSKEFPKTAIEEKFHDLQSTKEDLNKLKIPLVFIVAEKDTWVRLDDVKMLFLSYPNKDKELFIMKDTMHLVCENPEFARNVIKQIVVSLKRYMLSVDINESDVQEPGLREIASQNRIEKMRLRRLSYITKESEKEFWKRYLNKYVFITKSKDFRNLLSLVEICLGAPKENEKILDAGCGNGHFGAWLLSTTATRYKGISKRNRLFLKRNYIGIDFIESALTEAKQKHEEIYKAVKNALGTKYENDFFRFEYFCLDMEKKLPFSNNHFNKICCNLVLPYLKNPFFTLTELFRVLKPEGRLVASSLKPHPDLSCIYTDFVQQGQSMEDIQQARVLLSGAGKIKKKESEGHYQFFSEQHLKSLFNRVRAVNIKSYKGFGDQAIVVVGEKKT